MDFIVMVIGLEMIDDMLPIGCQDITSRTLQALVNLNKYSKHCAGFLVLITRTFAQVPV